MKMTKNKINPEKLCATLETADTPWKRAKGLMFRKNMKKNHGMIFKFDNEAKHKFWAMFMRFPIDIYFLDKNYQVVDSVRRAEPISLLKPRTWRNYEPKKPAKFVLEIKSR